MKNVGTIGPSKNSLGGDVIAGYYHDGSTAIIVMSDRGKECTATVCLAPEGPTPKKGFVWLKGWSENEGVPEALEKSGIVKRTGDTIPTGWGDAELAELLVDVE